MNLSTVKWAQWDKTQSRELLGLFMCVCALHCAQNFVAHSIAQKKPDNFPSYPPDNHHCSDDVYLREAGCLKWVYVVCYSASELVRHSSRWADGRSPAEQGADNGDAGDCLHAGEVGHHYTQGRRAHLHAACTTDDLCEYFLFSVLHNTVCPGMRLSFLTKTRFINPLVIIIIIIIIILR